MANRVIRLSGAAGALIAALSLAGVAAAADTGITISDFAFSPATLTVAMGDTVTWTNGDGVGHTATGAGFDTGTIAGGGTASVTFATAGTFAYACAIHPAMHGTVVVQAAGGVTHGDGVTTAPPTDTVAPGGPGAPSGPGGGLTILALAALAGLVLAIRRPARAVVPVPQAKR